MPFILFFLHYLKKILIFGSVNFGLGMKTFLQVVYLIINNTSKFNKLCSTLYYTPCGNQVKKVWLTMGVLRSDKSMEINSRDHFSFVLQDFLL